MRPGVVLQGRYEILRALGGGSQGSVFEAVDRRLGTRVAVKRSQETQEQLRQAFVREARLLASLRHPSLPVVSDHFVQTDGQFLVLELVPGEDVAALLHREQRPCTVAEAMTWADQLLDALEYLHRQAPPIIHRDIKPANLRVRTDGRLMLLDFGIAKGRPAQDAHDGFPASLHGYSEGYAPLEQMLRRGTDVRSDLYAAGATLYFLLSRTPPVDATVREHRRTRRGDPLRPLTAHNPEVPPMLARAVHRALELDPAARFQTAAEMRQALARSGARSAGRADQWPGRGPAVNPRPSGEHPAVPRVPEDTDADPPTLLRARPAPRVAPEAAPKPMPQPTLPDRPVEQAAASEREKPHAPQHSLTPPPAGPLPADALPLPDVLLPSDLADPFLTPAIGLPVIEAALPERMPFPTRGPASELPAAARQLGGSATGSADGNAPAAGPARRLGEGFQLVLAHGEQRQDRWPLPTDRPVTIGRSAEGTPPPDIDVRPDRTASRQHARVWRSDHHWWIMDVGSRRGTLVDGRPLTPHTQTILRPWSVIQCGETVLFLAPPGWRRLRSRDLTLDLELVEAVSSSLYHAGLPVIGRMIARNTGTATLPACTVRLALEPCFGPVSVSVPALRPATSEPFQLPPIALRYDVLEGQIERSRRRLAVAVDGDSRLGQPIECWLLPHNEWSTLPEHQRALATFVLPNHPAVAAIAAEITTTVDPEAPAEQLLAALFELLSERWQLTYRLEPPHWATDSQKVRLPHAVLLDDGGHRGEGTCLDLALLAAACLENLGLQPLVAVLDLGEWWHAVVGCWELSEAGVEAVRFDTPGLLQRALWLDPTCATRDREIRRPYGEARAEAERLLREHPLLFALDVAAARAEEIMPLPFAGQPVWSAAVGRAIEAAHTHARAASGQLCSAALLAGLLTAGDGLTCSVVTTSVGDTDRAAQTITASLPASPPAPPVSTGYQHVLDMARSRAKSAGSPVVLEAHLLGALLSLRSGSLDWALGRLGTDQQQLMQALHALDDGPHPGTSTYYGSR